MPLARRLSNSSQEAFTDFCSKNQPLSRRLSISSDAESISRSSRRDSIATQRGQRVLKRRNQSRSLAAKEHMTRSNARRHQISVNSPEPKKQRTTRSRGNNGKENNEIGENGREGLTMMSPTPYWKVAKERGDKFSPRETRSARKKRLKNSGGKSFNFNSVEASKQKDGILLFSPPNQVENARREKMEQDKKNQERNERIDRKRRSGQLLVFSKSLESLTNLPFEDISNNDYEEHSTSTVKQQPRKERDAGLNVLSNKDEEKNFSYISMNEAEQERDMEEFSCLTKSTNHGENSKEMMNVIKGLGEKFDILDRRLSEFRPPLPTVDQSSNVFTVEEIEEKNNQIKKLFLANSQLETQNKTLDLELAKLKSDLIGERAELEEIKSLNESLESNLNTCKEKNTHLSEEIIPKIERKLKTSLEESKRFQEKLSSTSSRLQEYEAKMEKLKSINEQLLRKVEDEKAHFQSFTLDIRRGHEEQQLENTKKDQVIKELKESLSLAESELDNERSNNNEKMIELQDTLQQFKNTKLEKEQLQKQFSEFKNAIVTKNKETNAAVSLVEEERDLLQKRLEKAENVLRSITKERNDALVRLGAFDQREDELFNKLRESDRVRKELHARVMVLIGNIRVFVRVRPPLQNELEESNIQNEQIFKFSSGAGTLDDKNSSKYGCDDPTKNILEVREPYKDRGGLSQRRKKWSFGFDNVFDPSHSQMDLWEATEPLVQCAIDGFNVTLFAYGQTGSGKTFTMLGDSESPADQGIIFRSIRKLFDAKTKIEHLSRGDKSVTMTVELLEIYNEQVRDLLSNQGASGSSQTLLKVSGNKVVGNVQQTVIHEASVHEILKKAQQRRTVKATSSNATSSRSHLLFTIKYTISSKDGTSQEGKLNICDLAGSERLSKSGANAVGGSLLKETKHINLSLSSLSNVIEKLQAGDKNVPFRDSKLTSLLQNSLGGNSKTLCIICCNPLKAHFHETLCSLRFAAKINKVDLKSVQNFRA